MENQLSKQNYSQDIAQPETRGRLMKGIVMSDKMNKTVVVAVTRLKEHPKYRKRYKVTTRYKAHDENNEFKVGDIVIIRECKPISKEKSWVVISRIDSRISANKLAI